MIPMIANRRWQGNHHQRIHHRLKTASQWTTPKPHQHRELTWRRNKQHTDTKILVCFKCSWQISISWHRPDCPRTDRIRNKVRSILRNNPQTIDCLYLRDDCHRPLRICASFETDLHRHSRFCQFSDTLGRGKPRPYVGEGLALPAIVNINGRKWNTPKFFWKATYWQTMPFDKKTKQARNQPFQSTKNQQAVQSTTSSQI